MKRLIKSIVLNPHTTLVGAGAGGAIIQQGIDTNNWKLILAGSLIALMGVFASDVKK